MTRTEFDMQVSKMKAKANEAIRKIDQLQHEVKEKIAENARMVHQHEEEIAKLHQQRIALSQLRMSTASKTGAEIRAWIEHNLPNTTSNLAEASLGNILCELRRRGFGGIITRQGEDGSEESYDIQQKFRTACES